MRTHSCERYGEIWPSQAPQVPMSSGRPASPIRARDVPTSLQGPRLHRVVVAARRAFERLVREHPAQWLMFEVVWAGPPASVPQEIVPQAVGLRRR